MCKKNCVNCKCKKEKKEVKQCTTCKYHKGSPSYCSLFFAYTPRKAVCENWLKGK